MRPGRLYGRMRPAGGVEIGLRRETENGRVYASIYIQSMAAGQPGGGTFLSKADAKKMIRWLEKFLKDDGS